MVRGYEMAKNDWMFEKRLNDHVWGLVKELGRCKPALVFCSSRAGTVETAQRMMREAAKEVQGRGLSSLIRDEMQQQRLKAVASQIPDAKLRDCLAVGVAFHHSGEQWGLQKRHCYFTS